MRPSRLLFVTVLMVFAFCSFASAEEHKKGDKKGDKKGGSSTTTSAPTARPTPAPTARPPQPVATPAVNRHPSGNTDHNTGNHNTGRNNTGNSGVVQEQPKRDGDKPKREGGGVLGVLGAIAAGADAINDAKRERDDRRDDNDRRDGDRGERYRDDRGDRREHRDGRYERHSRHVRGQAFYIDYLGGQYYEGRYENYGENDHALFPVQYDDGLVYFAGVVDNNNRIGPHFKTLALKPVLRNFYWPYPYAPQAGIHTYWLPRKQARTTCDDGRPCYDYWDWKKATISIGESDVEAVYSDNQSDEDR